MQLEPAQATGLEEKTEIVVGFKSNTGDKMILRGQIMRINEVADRHGHPFFRLGIRFLEPADTVEKIEALLPWNVKRAMPQEG